MHLRRREAAARQDRPGSVERLLQLSLYVGVFCACITRVRYIVILSLRRTMEIIIFFYNYKKIIVIIINNNYNYLF
jgi:hypothetical protein